MAKPPKIVGNSAIGVAFSEGARMWPFLFGFCTTLGLVTWMSQNLDHYPLHCGCCLQEPVLLCCELLAPSANRKKCPEVTLYQPQRAQMNCQHFVRRFCGLIS